VSAINPNADDLRWLLDRARRDNSRLVDRAYRAISVSTRASVLFAALDRLHATLDCDAVVRAIDDILTNVVGAEQHAIFEIAADQAIRLVSSTAIENVPAALTPGEGIVAKSIASGTTFVRHERPEREGHAWEEALTACIPLRLGKRPFGAIALFALAQHKEGFNATDLDLFRLLETHAAVALRASSLEHDGEPDSIPFRRLTP
jgi:GAF domain-containing protein